MPSIYVEYRRHWHIQGGCNKNNISKNKEWVQKMLMWRCFVRVSSNSAGPVQNATGPVQKYLWACSFFNEFRTMMYVPSYIPVCHYWYAFIMSIVLRTHFTTMVLVLCGHRIKLITQSFHIQIFVYVCIFNTLCNNNNGHIHEK